MRGSAPHQADSRPSITLTTPRHAATPITQAAPIRQAVVCDSPVVLGLDFGGTKIAMAVCEVSGDRLGSATVGSGGELGAQASFERGIGAASARYVADRLIVMYAGQIAESGPVEDVLAHPKP